MSDPKTPGPVPDPRASNPSNQDAPGAQQESPAPLLPSISPPKGGGAIRGMGEKFAANPVTGSGSMTVPIPVSPGRSGFGPQLSLAYDSGSGNGPFGFGWSLSLPKIARKTDKGLPRYLDSQESDVFVLSGAEDLVPLLDDEGARHADTQTVPGTVIERYRPRTEGLFARIERWTEVLSGEVHWRSISKDNVTTIYGRDDASRIVGPRSHEDDSARVFEWLICESYDDKGNAIRYEYVAEDDANVDVHRASEARRDRGAQRYLKRIHYGNGRSRLIAPDLETMQWLFEVVFDYDEGHLEELPFDPDRPQAEQHRHVRAGAVAAQPWALRPDSFSSYRAGFEVRTHRRCRRVLMVHRFDELGPLPQVVRCTEFLYEDLQAEAKVDEILDHAGSTPIRSALTRVVQRGLVPSPDGASIPEGQQRYRVAELPPLEFEYSKAEIQSEVKEIDRSAGDALPLGVDGQQYQWVDLHGEGLSGVLTRQGGAWYYQGNRGQGRLGPRERLPAQPAAYAHAQTPMQLVDLAGDGQLDVVNFSGPNPGFYERGTEQGWSNFRSFRQVPNVDWQDPNLRTVDLTGDGHADVLVTEHEVLTWYPSEQEEGFGEARKTAAALDENVGPRVVFSNPEQTLFLADMSGDGLSDFVRVRNGELCYWPNLGYGRFGAKVAMDNAPLFEHADQFDPSRLRLADIDGSGTVDVIYLGSQGVSLYFNLSGNGWSEAKRLPQFPLSTPLTTVSTADLLGNGTACLVWSSPLPADAQSPLRYIDLMGGQKPHLLVRSTNNLGAETRVHYAPSTKFYLADKKAGTPWVTKLPFPVHVVERVETFDRVGRNRFVSRYAYHHGYFDGAEREFRGFGMVEQFDTEAYAALQDSTAFPVGDNIQRDSHVPPVHTKTWFHTGVYLGRDRISNFFAGLLDAQDHGEYFREPGLSDAQAKVLLLPDTILPEGLSVDEAREACRALRGSVLRQEVYALDGSEQQGLPYSVTESNYRVRCLQRRKAQRHGVFITHPHESLAYHYERAQVRVSGRRLVDDAAADADGETELRMDPRIAHSLTLEVDDYGNVLKSASVGYARRFVDPSIPAPVQAEQAKVQVTYQEQRVSNAVDEQDDHRVPALVQARSFELTGFTPSGPAGRFVVEDFVERQGSMLTLRAQEELPYEATPSGSTRQARCIEEVRTLFRRDDLSEALPLGEQQSKALPYESYKLALTPGMVTQLYEGRVTPDMLGAGSETPGGHYVHAPGWDGQSDPGWWIPSGRVFFSPGDQTQPAQELDFARQHFFLPHRARDPFHRAEASTESEVRYDAYDLLLLEARDVLGNRTCVGERGPEPDSPVTPAHDYRVLQPRLVMDPNRNRSALAYDALGMVAATAVMGKPEEQRGDELDGELADLTPAQISVFRQDPRGPVAHEILGRASSRIVYDLHAVAQSPDPSAPQPTFAATLLREQHHHDPLAPATPRLQRSFSYSDGMGREIQRKAEAEPGFVPLRDEEGRILLDDDLQVLFDESETRPRWIGSGWTLFNNKGKPVRQYEPFFCAEHDFEFEPRVGPSPVLFYDPVARVVATLHPDRTWEKVRFDPWRQESWDVGDTVLVDDPRADRDVGGYFARLDETQEFESWYAARIDGERGTQDQQAARQSEIYAATPSVAFADALGRTVATRVHNRTAYNDGSEVNEELLESRVVLDLEGNEREVIDAKGRVIMRYAYDMLGQRVHQSSMESGKRWSLGDVGGQPLYAWTERGHRMRSVYDRLRRPVESYLLEPGADAEALVGRTVYGESRPEPEGLNLRGQAVEVYDQAGMIGSGPFDFKGNALEGSRRLVEAMVVDGERVPAYRQTVDWSGEVEMAAEVFRSATRYDGVNRPVQLIPAHSDKASAQVHVVQPVYNEANLLERMDVWLDHGDRPGAPLDPEVVEPSKVGVAALSYDAKGQREFVAYKNGVETRYGYDPQSYRLTRMRSVGPQGVLQDLQYGYDAVGNITHLRDEAQQTIFFRNTRVEPHARYWYDATSRLVEATGREHVGQAGGQAIPHSANDAPRVNRPHPGDGGAMARYLERYVYDEVGNVLEMRHRGSDGGAPGWTRRYRYEEGSQLEAGVVSNRLTGTQVGSGVDGLEVISEGGSGYDLHGNMVRMPHLEEMRWDGFDRLAMTQRQAGGSGVERTFYVYDGGGERVRKVTEFGDGRVKEERVYLGGTEVYRRFGDGALERETLHVVDDGGRVAMVESRLEGEGDGEPAVIVRGQLGNHLGSVSLEVGVDGRVIGYEEYSPYGSTTYQASVGELGVKKRYRYTGMERDEESGFGYHSARYYAGWLGRWTSADPAGLVDGGNLYRYCRCSPVGHVDSRGTQSQSEVDPTVTIVERANFSGNETQDEIRQRFANIGIFYEGDATLVRHGRNDELASWVVEEDRQVEADPEYDFSDEPIDVEASEAATEAPAEQASSSGGNLGLSENQKTGLVLAGAGGGLVPVVGDFVSLGTSFTLFVDDPSWSNLVDVGLDGVGAALPFVPALGTIRKAGKMADAADAVHDAERALEGADAAHDVQAATNAADRAKEIHQAVPSGTQRRTTIAVTETAEGTRVVSSSERRLRPAQRAQLRAGEVEGVGVGHAEVTGVNAARSMSLTPTGTAASRPICSNCASFLEAERVAPLSPLKHP